MERSAQKPFPAGFPSDLADAALIDSNEVGWRPALAAASSGDENVDFHIGIGFDEAIAADLRKSGRLLPVQRKALTQSSVIVEMTPHFRALFEPNWTFESLKANIGRKVKVLGQLRVDNEHIDSSQDCAFRSDRPVSCWRSFSVGASSRKRFLFLRQARQRLRRHSERLGGIGPTSGKDTGPGRKV